MGYRYSAIRRYQLELLNRNTAHFRECVDVMEGLGELMLWGMEHLPSRATGDEEADPMRSMTTVLIRLFNDFEVAKLCALRGLPDQASGPLRDTIECMMLVRLFQAEPKAAARWLSHANEYMPSDVYAALSKLGIAAPEFAAYSFMSDRTHPNVIGSLGTLTETDHGGGLITVQWGAGGYDSPTQIRLTLLWVCLFQLLALTAPLRTLFVPHLAGDLKAWREAVQLGRRAVGGLWDQVSSEPPDDPGGASRAVAKIDKKVRKLEKRLLSEMQKVFGPGFSFDD